MSYSQFLFPNSPSLFFWRWGGITDHLGNRIFASFGRCVIVPHIGSATFETRLGMVNLAAENALAAIDEEAMPAELDVAARIVPQP